MEIPTSCGDDFCVFDADGNRLGLTCKLDGKEYIIPLVEVPEGATSGAWEGPWVTP